MKKLSVHLLVDEELFKKLGVAARNGGATLEYEMIMRLEDSFHCSQPAEQVNCHNNFISVTREKIGDVSQITILIPLRES